MEIKPIFLLLIGVHLLYFGIKLSRKKKLRQALKENPLIIDVRSEEEYKSGHYKNSINIPLPMLSQKMDDIQSKKEKIIVICASGMRSGQAKRMLSKRGISCINGGSWKSL